MTVQVAQASAASGVDVIEAARLTPEEVVARLVSSESRLSASESAARLDRFGPNAIRSHGARPRAILERQLRNALLILLAAATITSLIVGERTDAIIILAIVGLSVGLDSGLRSIAYMGTTVRGRTALPVGFLLILAVMVVVYLLLVEIGKSFFFGLRPSRPHLPVASWRLPRAAQRIERLASRWTVRLNGRIDSVR